MKPLFKITVEKPICEKCNEGEMIQIGNFSTHPQILFRCDNCGYETNEMCFECIILTDLEEENDDSV